MERCRGGCTDVCEMRIITFLDAFAPRKKPPKAALCLTTQVLLYGYIIYQIILLESDIIRIFCYYIIILLSYSNALFSYYYTIILSYYILYYYDILLLFL